MSRRRRWSLLVSVPFWVASCSEDAASTGNAAGEDSGAPPPLDVRETVYDEPGKTTVTESSENIAQLTQQFEFPGHIAPTQRWTQRTSGLCGQKCRNGPRHMYSAAFGDTLLVSWMAVDPDDPWRQYGNVATLQVSERGEFTLKRNVAFDGLCEATYGIATNADGSVIAVLCRGIQGVTSPIPEAIDLLGTRRQEGCTENWEGRCYPIGNYSALDSALYILEYRGGAVTASPDDIVYVNHAVGGWRYGHHELMLNDAEDTYFVHLKVTAGPSEDNRHEGMTRFGIRRTPEFAYVPVNDEWGCGAGHVPANRMAYNRANNVWSQLCMLDSCPVPSQYENGRCNSISFSTITPPADSGGRLQYEGEYVLELDQGENSWDMSGGVSALLSLGADGWLALAAGPGYPSATPKPDTIGVLPIPVTIEELRTRILTEEVPLFEGGTQSGVQQANRYQWNWLYLPATETDKEPRAGMGALAYFGTSGEASERLLVGWSPTVAFQGITAEYVVSELDRAGNVRGEAFRLRTAGWGEDNRWQTMPNSGCVVFPFAWVGDAPGNDYPIESNEAVATNFPTTLHFTSLCPNSDAQPPLANTPAALSDRERWPAP